MLQKKRIYEKAEKTDGKRILVDRIWPRGISRQQAHIDSWAKELTPSTELRKWFNHQPERFDDFKKAYLDELTNNPEALITMKKIAAQSHEQMITLVFAAKDPLYNHVVILMEALVKQFGAESK